MAPPSDGAQVRLQQHGTGPPALRGRRSSPRANTRRTPSFRSRIQFVSPRAVRLRLRTGPEVQSRRRTAHAGGRARARHLLEIREGRGRPSLHQRRRLRDHHGEPLARRAARRVRARTHPHPAHEGLLEHAGARPSRSPSSADRRTSRAAWPPSSRSSPGEKLFGCGESFTRLDKRGQRVVLWTNDANGVENERMYKPVPFFLSSRGYGMFVHTTGPATFDMGASYHGSNALLLGDDEAGPVRVPGIAQGRPRRIHDADRQAAHAAAVVVRRLDEPHLLLLRGRDAGGGGEAAREPHPERRDPPRHGLVRDGLAHRLRVLEDALQGSREDDRGPQAATASTSRSGSFRTSCPRTASSPRSWRRACSCATARASFPYEDAVLDFSNPDAVKWYREKIAGLLRLGVGAIKVDFGEAAPLTGIYALRPQRLLRAQPLPAALQQGRGRRHQGSHGREHHLGAQRLGGQPALSHPLGRRRGQDGHRHGRHPARRPLPRALRLHVLEPRHRRLLRATRPRTSITAGSPSGCSSRTAAATARRPRSRGSSAPASSPTIAARRR